MPFVSKMGEKIMASICLGGPVKGSCVWALLVAALLAGSPSLAESEAASFEPEPRMMKPATVIDENGRVVMVKSKLLNWMDEDLGEFFESGLPLRLSFKAAIFEERGFWFDAQLASAVVKKQVSYDPVKKSYTVIVLRGEEDIIKEFVDEKEAMQSLLSMETEIPIHLFMEKYPRRTYYAGVYCDVTASEVDFPLGHLLWFLRTGYTTDWFYSENISTQVLQSDGPGKSRSSSAAGKIPRTEGGAE